MKSFSSRENWIGSQVITYETAKLIGWVKKVRPSPGNNNETWVLVVPNRCLWFPKSMTGACEFSSRAVLISGEGCLLVTNQAEIRAIPENVYLKKMTDSINKLIKVILFLIAISPLLLFLPIFVIFLVILGCHKIYKKVFSRPLSKRIMGHPVQYWDDGEDEDEGLSRIRQPNTRGPQPTDNIELENPIIEREEFMELFPVTRLQ
jgi:hypothetical protein